MRLFVRPSKPLVRDVGVNLRSGQRGVAEHLLHAAQIGTAFEQMRGHGMPKSMRSEVRGAVNDPQCAMNDSSYHPWIDSSAAVPDKDCRAGIGGDEPGSRWPEPGFQGVEGGGTDRHAPFLAALAEHSDGAPVCIDVVDVQSDQLR